MSGGWPDGFLPSPPATEGSPEGRGTEGEGMQRLRNRYLWMRLNNLNERLAT